MESYSLYNEEVALTFDPVKHIYRANGEIVEGATSILKCVAKPALVPWAANMAAEYVSKNLKPGIALDELQIIELCSGAKSAHRVKSGSSASLGQLAHTWFEDYFEGRQPPVPFNKDLKNMVDSFLQFVKEHEIKPLETERRLFSRKLNYAGSTDLICLFNGELTIADYKTSRSGIYPEHLIQLGAYDLCYHEEVGDKPTRHLIINCNAKGELKITLSKEVDRNRQAFISVLHLHRSLKEIAQELKNGR